MRVTDLTSIDDSHLNFHFNFNSSYEADTNPSNNLFDGMSITRNVSELSTLCIFPWLSMMTIPNAISVSIPLLVDAKILVTGSSRPADAVIYNSTHMSGGVMQGPTVDHRSVSTSRYSGHAGRG